MLRNDWHKTHNVQSPSTQNPLPLLCSALVCVCFYTYTFKHIFFVMTSRSGFCARRSIRNGTHFYITAEHKSQSSPLLFMRTCCSLTGALHAPTTLNECGVPIFRALRSTLPPEHTLRRACHCVHVVSNYNVAMIVRCIGQHTDINLNSMKGLQMSPCAWLVKNDKKQSAGPGPHAASSIASGFTRSFSKQLTHSASARMI